MRAFLAALALLSAAWAQTLVVPPEVPVGSPLTLEGQNLPQGRFPLVVEGPTDRTSLEVEPQGGSFRQTFVPQAPGEYRVRLSLPSGPLEARFAALPPVQPELTPEGLRLPWGVFPLPGGPWLGPLVQGERVFVAQGLLVVEVSLRGQEVAYHFAPARVVALRPGPEAVLLGERVLPIPFPPLPFEGTEADLRALAPLLQALNPPKPWPYFAYWTQDPKELSPEDLAAYGQDLKARQHRPELFFGQPGVRRMAEASRALRQQDPAKARLLAQTLLEHTPLFPDSLAFFRETAAFLEAQGQPAEALRFREAEKVLRTWLPPNLSALPTTLGVLALAYLLLLAYLFLFYLPAQLRDLRALGGYLGGFLRHPLLRLRHLHLAYASLGERLLALLLLLALLSLLLFAGFHQRVRQSLLAPPLDQGTLRSEAALEWLRQLPPLPESKGLLGYALLPQNPKEAQALLKASQAPFALALRGEEEALAQAYLRAPLAGPIRTALGLGEDPWGEREAGPSLRDLYLALLRVELARFQEDPWKAFLSLPLPLPQGLRPWAFAGLLLLLLLHLLAFFLPRRKGAVPPSWALAVRLFVPGSLGFSGGVGLLLLLLAAYGFTGLLRGQGPWPLLLAYGLHLLAVVWSLRRSP
ncbi:MAG: hypothetical protein ABDH20_02700 [Thermus sp.]